MSDFIMNLHDNFQRSCKEYLALLDKRMASLAEIQRTTTKMEGIQALLRLEGVNVELPYKTNK